MFISLKMVLIGIDPYPYANRPSWHFIIFFGCLLWQWLRNCPIWRGLAGERVHEVFSESCVNPNQMFHSLLLPCATLLYFNGQGPCRPCMHSHKHPLRKGVCCVWGGSYCILFATHPPISTSSSCFYYLRCYKKVIFACKWSALKCSPISLQFCGLFWRFFPQDPPASACWRPGFLLASAPAWKQQHLSAAAPDLWMESPGEHMGLLSRDTGWYWILHSNGWENMRKSWNTYPNWPNSWGRTIVTDFLWAKVAEWLSWWVKVVHSHLSATWKFLI